MPESTAMVIYTVLNHLTEGIFFLFLHHARPHAPPPRKTRAEGCCLLKDYTFFRAIHILKVYTFYGYTYFRGMHILIYHIHILLYGEKRGESPRSPIVFKLAGNNETSETRINRDFFKKIPESPISHLKNTIIYEICVVWTHTIKKTYI